MSSLFVVTVERHRDLRIVRPVGELDISTVDELTTVVERECSSQADVVVDLSGLSFLDCAGLRVLLYAHALATSNGSSLSLIRGPTTVQRIFDLTGLHHRFRFVSPAGVEPARPRALRSSGGHVSVGSMQRPRTRRL
jgi:anti-anti-sigma factor